jgi:hypothetical protein
VPTPALVSKARCAGRGSAARVHRPTGAEPADVRQARRRLDRVETADVLGEHARLRAIGGIDLDPEPGRTPGTPLMFMLRDPDGTTSSWSRHLPPNNSFGRERSLVPDHVVDVSTCEALDAPREV